MMLSSKKIHLTTPLKSKDIETLRIGDQVYISGTIYSARDAAHARLIQLIRQKKELPFDTKGQIIYYVGPAPAPPDKVIGSAGPTTSYRMDPFAPALLDCGLKAMIGKGRRSQKVIDSMIKNKAVYLVAVGGAAVLIAKSIIKSELIAYEDLGTEAIYKMQVKEFPCIVANDIHGNDIYKAGVNKYKIRDLFFTLNQES